MLVLFYRCKTVSLEGKCLRAGEEVAVSGDDFPVCLTVLFAACFVIPGVHLYNRQAAYRVGVWVGCVWVLL